MVPCKLLEFRSKKTTSPLPPHLTPVHVTAHGNEVAVLPLQFQPVKEAMVGVTVGADAVGARVKGAAEGERVGFDGQFVIPSLKAQRALASDC